jgi:hypothetical protein
MRTRMVPITCVVAVSIFLAPGAGAKHESSRPTEVDLENSVVQAPSSAGRWLELALFHDAHGQQVPAILGYTRFLTLNQDPGSAKQAAARVWALVVPGASETASAMSMRPPQTDDDLWWQTDLLMVTFRSARRSGKAASLSDVQFLATVLEGVTVYLKGLDEDKRLSPLWRQVGIPYFVEAREKGHLESLAHDVAKSVSEAASHWIETNPDAVARYRAWSQKWKPGA